MDTGFLVPVHFKTRNLHSFSQQQLRKENEIAPSLSKKKEIKDKNI